MTDSLLVYAMPEWWQRVAVWGLLAVADVLIVGLAIFLWVAGWRQEMVQMCEKGDTIWKVAVFATGEWVSWQSAVGSCHRCPC